MRELCILTNVIDASKKYAEIALKQKFNIFLIPGGEIEQCESEYKKEIV